MARRPIGTIVRSAVGTDWPAVRWVAPARIGVVTVVVMTVALVVSDAGDAIPVALGLIFAGIADPRGFFGLRLRAFVLATLGMAVAAELGLLVAGHALAHVAVAAVMALICGYIGLAGPRAALAGVLSLVMFAIYSGTPEPLGESFRTGGLVLLGGLIVTVAILGPLFLRRMGGVRADVAIAFRALGFAVRDDPAWQYRDTAVARLEAARASVAESGAEGATAAWYDDLLGAAARLHLVLLALQAERVDAAAGPIARLVAPLASLMLAAAAAIELEPRRRRMPPARATLEEALAEVRRDLPGRLHPLLDAVAVEAARIDAALEPPYPLGRHAEFQLVRHVTREGLVRVWRRLDPDRVYARHGLRLAVAFAIATAITVTWSMPHDYWFPMTVAWMMKPDYAATMPRLASRVIGVVAGSLATGTAFAVTDGGGPLLVVAIMGLAAVVFAAFIVPNYAIASFAITCFAVALLAGDGVPVMETAPEQIAAVLSAGVLVAVATRIRPTRLAGPIAADLARHARALARYGDALHGPSGADAGERTAARDAVGPARARAGQIVRAAQSEPGAALVERAVAARILRDLDDAGALAVAVDLGVHDVHPDEVDAHAVAALDELADRLEAVHDTGTCAPARPWPVDTRFGRFVADAGLALNVTAR
ncbi:MAG: FUSC family protein [Actinomycetota bacterium]